MNPADFQLFNDDLDILDIINFGFPRRIYERSNYFEEMDNLTFFKRFRLYKETVLYLLEQIEGDLEYPNDRNNCVSPINQLLCCLRFFASSGHLSSVADFMGLEVSTASRIVARVSRSIAHLLPNHISMPDEQDWVKEQAKCFEIARFPRIIGLVDGTHIKIQSPGGNDAEIFRNRKSYFSLNVQVVGSADLKFLDVIARWPGSVHDATIFANSNIRARFEGNHFPNCLLVGDSGYPLRQYFMTLLGDPQIRAEQLYNESLIRTRNAVERLIGLWKRRFPVIAYGIRLKMDTVIPVIIATVLHNIARNMNKPEPPAADEINMEELNYLIEIGNLQDIPNMPNADRNVNINFVQEDLIHNCFERN